MSSPIVVTFSLLPLLVSHIDAHMVLRFPPARDLDLDFLDNFSTPGDCGMEAGPPRAVLQSGSSLNLTWHLGFVHQGGYRLELVDPSENSTQLLLPEGGDENSWETSMGNYSQNHLVQLPNTKCDNCYLKFEYSYKWGDPYKFRSCADVRLVTSLGDEERCSNQGTWDGAHCQCYRFRKGDRCQYETLCQTDADCNGSKGQGRCMSVDPSIFPYKECYCADGWYGEQCEKENRWGAGRARTVNETAFSRHQLGNGAELLWRVEGDEVEMVMTALTNTWVGIGWRPQGTDQACHQFPATIAKYTATDFFSGMDCTDMVIGAARQGVGRVADYYTRDRSTPRLDKVWGGEDDLTSAHAWEEDGNTRMRFLKKVSGGPGDHDIAGSLLVVWAHGQLDNFYLEDQLKYHSRNNRGITSLDLPELP